MLTMERASEIVAALRKSKNESEREMAMDLFCHCVEALNLESRFFAELCGYPIAMDIRPIDE